METNHLKVGTCISSFASLQKTARALVILFLFFFSYLHGNSQTTPFNFTQISTGGADLIAPGRGVEFWNGVQWDGSNAPTVPSGNTSTQNAYYRFTWTDFENSTQGAYNWTKFDNQINNAIDNGRSFSFGIMSMCSGCGNPGGLGYPTYLHNLMQGEANKDWFNSDGAWVPNWNSNNYLSNWESLLNALASHINSGTRNGVKYKDAIYYVDIRGYGDYGEWHNCCYLQQSPTGTRATSATLKRIIDAHKNAFPNYPLVAIITTFDTGNPSSTAQPADLAYYALTTSNNWGRLGWRRDNWGDAGYDNVLKNNTGSYNPGSGSVSFSSLIMNTYKYAPVVGEPSVDPNAISKNCGTPQCDLVNEIKTYHATSFGNGNYPNASDGNLQSSVRAASAASGYRLVLTGGNMNTSLTPGLPFNISLNWQNIGIAPTYDNWNIVYELRNSSGAVVWTSNSSFKLKLFIPSGSPSAVSENFTLPATVSSGTYNLYLVVRDPVNYKKPLPLAITGRNADGSYLLRSNVTVGPAGNLPPTASAGQNQTILAPASTVSLTGTATDADGSVTSLAWSIVSGPAGSTISSPSTASTNVTGLIQGVYVYRFSATDNQGATTTDDIQVTVNAAAPANQSPIAKAGADITITQPVNSTTLNGSSSVDPDGSILTYAWTKISGPSQFSLVNSSAASTVLNNLVPGIYSFRLGITDNGGATASDTVLVTVNAAPPANQNPIANAGADITVTLPSNLANLNGSGSVDPDGSITSYVWSKTSGPAQYAITNAALANTGISNLVEGSYTFKLTVTDNAGATATDLVNVTVNAAAPAPGNQAPVANVGGNINLTLPANTANLKGSASSDPDGTVSSYVWSKISGPGQFAIANPSLASTQVSNLVQGSYAFRLQVTDNGGLSGSDTLYITVNPAPAPTNQLPVANAGSSITITLPTNSVGLDGTTSWDPDGSVVKYSWTKVSGPGSSTIVNATSATPSIAGLVFGQYAFQLTVTDNSGGTAKDQVTVTVLNSPDAPPAAAAPVVNQAPVAIAGENITIPMTQSSITLNGTNSYDPDGNITSYTWKQVTGPSLAKILSTTGATTQVSSLAEGSYVFELDVTDNANASSSTAIKVDVVNTLRFTLSLKIYPNPVSSVLTFQYLSDLTGKIALDVYSTSGTRMFSAEYNKDQSLLSKQIDVSKLPKGLYYIKIIQPDGTKVSKSFWKK